MFKFFICFECILGVISMLQGFIGLFNVVHIICFGPHLTSFEGFCAKRALVSVTIKDEIDDSSRATWVPMVEFSPTQN